MAESDSVNTVTFVVIRVSGTDSVFYKNKKTSTLKLPVSPHVLQTTFTLQYYPKGDTVNSKTDSVKLTYVKQYFVVSPECGGYAYFSNLSVLSSSFVREPKVVNSQLSTGATTNLEIKL